MAGQPMRRKQMLNARHPRPYAPDGTSNPSRGIRNMTHYSVCVWMMDMDWM